TRRFGERATRGNGPSLQSQYGNWVLLGNVVILSGSPGPQRFASLLDDGVVGAAISVKVMDGSGQQVWAPLRTDPAAALEDGGKEFVLMSVVTGFAAQPAVGRLHEQRHSPRPVACQHKGLATRLIRVGARSIGQQGTALAVPAVVPGGKPCEDFH